MESGAWILGDQHYDSAHDDGVSLPGIPIQSFNVCIIESRFEGRVVLPVRLSVAQLGLLLLSAHVPSQERVLRFAPHSPFDSHPSSFQSPYLLPLSSRRVLLHQPPSCQGRLFLSLPRQGASPLAPPRQSLLLHHCAAAMLRRHAHLRRDRRQCPICGSLASRSRRFAPHEQLPSDSLERIIAHIADAVLDPPCAENKSLFLCVRSECIDVCHAPVSFECLQWFHSFQWFQWFH